MRCISFTELHITCAEPLPLAADGEAMEDARDIVVRVQAGALRVVVNNPDRLAAPYKL